MSYAVCAQAGRVATRLVEVSRDAAVLEGSGEWIVAIDFKGSFVGLRFDDWHEEELEDGAWPGVSNWVSDVDESGYRNRVSDAKSHIAAGDFYQVNVCRILSTDVPDAMTSLAGLYRLMRKEHPAPYLTLIAVDHPLLDAAGIGALHLLCVSPETFLQRRGDVLSTRPIKGTAPTGEDFLDKDKSENVMIVDLMRNDFAQVCEIASVSVPRLLDPEPHPGLVHLVSTVEGTLRQDITWTDILSATFPPGSVTGAPKSSALKFISHTESPRSWYCGAIGRINVDERTADLAVAIRTFWLDSGKLYFGAGAGITWGSDPQGEWHETELKTRALFEVAAKVIA